MSKRFDAALIDPVRSRIMRSVRQKDTKPEMIVRRALHSMGYRFRVNLRILPGSPDIVFPARRQAIFIHGCFWHRHLGCRLASTPKTRLDFWEPKFRANIDRDARKVHELEQLLWDVMIVWQCETCDRTALMDRLREFLGPPRSEMTGHGVGPEKVSITAPATSSAPRPRG